MPPFRLAAYIAGYTAKVWGFTPEIGMLAGAAGAGVLGPGRRLSRHPPPGHLLRDDHPGAGADGLLRLPPGALHRRRGRHPGVPRGACSASSTCKDMTVLYYFVVWRSSCSASG
jgi:hypothetical protein